MEPYQIRMDLANKASRMLDKVENVQIIDSLVVDKDDFLSAYTLSEESGTLTTYQDFFQTNDPGNSSVYMNQKGIRFITPTRQTVTTIVFYPIQAHGSMGRRKQLPMNINSDADDGYPFVLSDGVTIYYASKGTALWADMIYSSLVTTSIPILILHRSNWACPITPRLTII